MNVTRMHILLIGSLDVVTGGRVKAALAEPPFCLLPEHYPRLIPSRSRRLVNSSSLIVRPARLSSSLPVFAFVGHIVIVSCFSLFLVGG